jgi:hypothetical protein
VKTKRATMNNDKNADMSWDHDSIRYEDLLLHWAEGSIGSLNDIQFSRNSSFHGSQTAVSASNVDDGQMNLMDIENDVARTNADGLQANREGLASMQVDGQDDTQLHLSLMQQLQAQNELSQHHLGQIQQTGHFLSQSLNQALRSQSLTNGESVIPTSLNAQDQQMNSWLTELQSQQRQQIDTGQVDADQAQQQREQMKTNQINQAIQEASVSTQQQLDVAQQQSIKAHGSSFIDPSQQQMTLLQCLLSITNQQNTGAQTINFSLTRIPLVSLELKVPRTCDMLTS